MIYLDAAATTLEKPPQVRQAMAQAALAGDFDTAAALQAELLPLIELLKEADQAAKG